ncbi:low temperature requirement protein A [Streptomyces sp. NPDC008121]|uniref:low temperature requirement protein A n=1 Tax=Streptomyces sp. NPDC008121 TaxID=3364809 RepID=UPI0036E2B226
MPASPEEAAVRVPEPLPAGERHASWLELFFDLIAVAGVGQIAHLLHTGPTGPDLAEYVLLFLAFWLTWALFTMYGNIAGEGTRLLPMVAGMFGMSVMAAAVPGVSGSDDRAFAFALAFVLVRVAASRVWQARGQVLADLPVVRLGGGLVPWIVSLWADGDDRLWLWGVGLTIDMFVMVKVSRTTLQREIDEDWTHEERRHARRGPATPDAAAPDPGAQGPAERPSAPQAPAPPGPAPGDRTPAARAKPRIVSADVPHLAERLGLFTLIVLGEGLVQSVDAAGEAVWDRPLRTVGVAVFTVLVLLWSLTLRSGSSGLPLLAPGALPVRRVLPLHCVFTGAVAALAAALGRAMGEAEEALPSPARLLMGGALVVILLVAAVGALASGRGRWWTTAAVGPPLLVAVVPAATSWPEHTGAVTGLAVLTLLWPVLWSGRRPAI